MRFGTLLRVHFRSVFRRFSPRHRVIVLGGIVLLILYGAGILAISGYRFDRMVDLFEEGAEPVSFLNRKMLLVLVSLFSVRFFFQKTPRLSIQPYLHLPVARSRLVLFFQLVSLVNIHNVLPLFFFVPYWLTFVAPRYVLSGSVYWLGGVVALLVVSHYANIVLRTFLTVDLRKFFAIVGAILAFVVADRIVAANWLEIGSLVLFSGLTAGSAVFFWSLVAAAVTLFAYTSLLLYRRLRDEPNAGRRFRLWSKTPFAARRGHVGNLMLLELQMIWRNRRPRTYMLFALFFGTVYVALLLVDSRVSSNILMASLAGLFASGIFAVNHGQLMFSWESAYFDGILTRSFSPRNLVLSKMLTLQASCLIFFVINLPIFLGLAPDLLPLHVAFLLYNAGITSVLMVALAVHNRRRIAIEKGGGFFNYEGFSLRHWLWFLPTAVPPTLLLFALRDEVATGLYVLAAVGILGILLTGVWSRVFSRLLLRSKYVMADGFRTYEH